MKIMHYVRYAFVKQAIIHRCTQNRNVTDVFSVVGKVLRAIWFYCHLGEFVCARVCFVCGAGSIPSQCQLTSS